MSDALWLRIDDVLKTVDPSPPNNARTLLNALAHRALTGIKNENLPEAYPSPADVAAAGVRWYALGLFERLASPMRIRLFA